jgi:hypothetical protein
MATRKKLLKYQEIATRLNGVQAFNVGAQWVASEPERKIVRDVLTFFEDRRVLFNPCAWELPNEVTDSVLRIREQLTQALQRLGEDSKAAPAMRAMRATCREYLDRSQQRYGHHDLSVDLGRLRALFGTQIAFLAYVYRIDLEEDLASIIPPRFADVLDDGDLETRPLPPRR